jgi:RNA polymerase sigma-70 factor (ECF subfamily)
LFHRAKVKVSTKPSSSEPSVTSPGAVHTRRQAQRAVAERFAMAFKAGDTARVRELLTEDVTFVADGGGKALAARRPLAGREAVSSFLFGIVRSAQASGAAAHASVHVTEVNTEPALVLRVGGTIDGVFVLTVNGETIQSIRVVRNPDKLAYIDRQLTRTH